MPNPSPNRQLTSVLERAKKRGWVVNEAARGRFKLTHPKAKKALMTPADTKQADALRNLEAEMKAALGPVQSMQTNKAERISRASVKTMGDDELRTRLLATQARLLAKEQEIATFKRTMEELDTTLANFRLFQSALRGMLQGSSSKRPLRPQAAARAPAPAAAKPIDQPGKAAASTKAPPAGKAAAARKPAATKKAAGPGAGRKKAAAPAKRARKAETKEAASPPEKTPLEQAIDEKKREAGAGPGAEAKESGTLSTLSGEAVTQENAGRLIRAHRAARGDTQVKAAPMLKASVTTLINWETGHTKPQHSALPKIAEYLQSPVTKDHSSSLGA